MTITYFGDIFLRISILLNEESSHLPDIFSHGLLLLRLLDFEGHRSRLSASLFCFSILFSSLASIIDRCCVSRLSWIFALLRWKYQLLLELESETCRCVSTFRAKLNIFQEHWVLNKEIVTVRMCAWNRFLGMKPIGVTFQFGHGFLNIIVEISLRCTVIIFLCESGIVNKSFSLWIEVICEILELVVLEDWHLLYFVWKLWTRDESIFVFIELFEDCFCLGV